MFFCGRVIRMLLRAQVRSDHTPVDARWPFDFGEFYGGH